MATKTYDTVTNWGAIYCAGGFGDHWNGSWGDPVWTRNGKDSGKIKIATYGYHAYRNVRWIRPGQAKWGGLVCNGTEYATNSPGVTTFHDCSGNDAMAVSCSKTWEGIQTSDNTYGTLNFDIRCHWGDNNNNFTIHDDLGIYPCVIELDDNFKISSPENVTGSLTTKTPSKIVATASCDEWSKNENITGNPYTDDGGRSWNWRAQIIVSGTVVYEITKNTGETKNATFTFDDLSKLANVPVDTNVTIKFTCSNNYQQTTDYSTTFKLPFYGYVIKTGSTKKIRYFQIIEDRGTTTVSKISSGYPRKIT